MWLYFCGMELGERGLIMGSSQRDTVTGIQAGWERSVQKRNGQKHENTWHGVIYLTLTSQGFTALLHPTSSRGFWLCYLNSHSTEVETILRIWLQFGSKKIFLGKLNWVQITKKKKKILGMIFSGRIGLSVFRLSWTLGNRKAAGL